MSGATEDSRMTWGGWTQEDKLTYTLVNMLFSPKYKCLGVYLPERQKQNKTKQGSSKKRNELGRAEAVPRGQWLHTAELAHWHSDWLWAGPALSDSKQL